MFSFNHGSVVFRAYPHACVNNGCVTLRDGYVPLLLVVNSRRLVSITSPRDAETDDLPATLDAQGSQALWPWLAETPAPDDVGHARTSDNQSIQNRSDHERDE